MPGRRFVMSGGPEETGAEAKRTGTDEIRRLFEELSIALRSDEAHAIRLFSGRFEVRVKSGDEHGVRIINVIDLKNPRNGDTKSIIVKEDITDGLILTLFQQVTEVIFSFQEGIHEARDLLQDHRPIDGISGGLLSELLHFLGTDFKPVLAICQAFEGMILESNLWNDDDAQRVRFLVRLVIIQLLSGTREVFLTFHNSKSSRDYLPSSTIQASIGLHRDIGAFQILTNRPNDHKMGSSEQEMPLHLRGGCSNAHYKHEFLDLDQPFRQLNRIWGPTEALIALNQDADLQKRVKSRPPELILLFIRSLIRALQRQGLWHDVPQEPQS